MAQSQVTPEVLWSQRSSSIVPEKNVIFLTIVTPDVSPSALKLELKPTGLTFTGHSDTKKATYHLELEFYAEIDVDNSKTHHTPRDVELILRKKEAKDEYWPRLLKDSKKMHFLKTDFDKWVDEDEQEEQDPNAMDFGNMGMEGMGGMGGMPGMGGMGGMPGMPGMNLGDMSGLDFSKMGSAGAPDSDDDLEDDDEMPGLEESGEETQKAGEHAATLTEEPAEKKAGIEEIS